MPQIVGRPRKKGELDDARIHIGFTPTENERLQEIKQSTGVPVATLIKRVLARELGIRDDNFDATSPLILAAIAETERSEPVEADPLEAFLSGGGDTSQLMELAGVSKSLPVLGSAPCGPLREVLESADAKHALSPTTWQWLESQAGDFFIICDGQSMEGAGIPDGALLMFRPLPDNGRPRAGEVALVQFFDEEGGCTSTIKRWMKSEPLTLHDGEGNAVAIPDKTNAVPVAVARGLVTRYF